jgi:hypothetical protein
MCLHITLGENHGSGHFYLAKNGHFYFALTRAGILICVKTRLLLINGACQRP